MNLFTAKEVVENYAAAGVKKTQAPVWKMLLLGILAGSFIALGCAATNTSAHNFETVSAMRTISGLLFPGGLILVILMGAELFTGNCLLSISLLDKKIGITALLKNWVFVYIGNFIGSVLTAFSCANFGQLNFSGGGLAVYTIRLATGKVALSFGNAFVSAIFCNVLVCLAVLCSLAAKDIAGRVLGTILPIAFFVICGFEHCVANMYYVPAGIFASGVPEYAAKAVEAGLDLSALTWGNFFVHNLLPVTLGNIAGGAGIGAILWLCHVWEGKKQ